MSDPVRDLKQELLAAAERQRGHAVSAPGRDRFGARRIRNRVLVVAALLPVVVAVSLFLTTPWKSSPGFLERAEAAFSATEPLILHMKWDTLGGTARDCGPSEIWQDQAPPHRYRLLVDHPRYWADVDMRKPVCTGDPPVEFGGTRKSAARARHGSGTFDTLEFRPPNRLVPFQGGAVFPVDPVADLRNAIGVGRAHDEGSTELDGRTVRRIRVDPPPSCDDSSPLCPRRPTYVYVDPETYYPVAKDGPGFVNSRTVHMKIRYLEFEYLPRTTENLELTDIRAQHPGATGP